MSEAITTNSTSPLPSFKEFCSQNEAIEFIPFFMCNSMREFYDRTGSTETTTKEAVTLKTFPSMSVVKKLTSTIINNKVKPVIEINKVIMPYEKRGVAIKKSKGKQESGCAKSVNSKKVKTAKFEANEFFDFKAGIHSTQLKQRGCSHEVAVIEFVDLNKNNNNNLNNCWIVRVKRNNIPFPYESEPDNNLYKKKYLMTCLNDLFLRPVNHNQMSLVINNNESIPLFYKSEDQNGAIYFLNNQLKEMQNQLTQSQQLIQELTTKINNLEEQVQGLITLNQNASKWTPVNCKEIGNISFTTKVIQSFNIPLDVIPFHAKEILVNYVFRSGSENNSWVNVWLWTEDEQGVQYKFLKKGYRYPQNAISFDNENIWMPFCHLKPNIYVTVDHLQTHICQGASMCILGYR
ncbi:hypothetical protein ABK040_013046 [Willaertia magna]